MSEVPDRVRFLVENVVNQFIAYHHHNGDILSSRGNNIGLFRDLFSIPRHISPTLMPTYPSGIVIIIVSFLLLLIGFEN